MRLAQVAPCPRLHQSGIPPPLDIPLEHRKELLDFVREAQEEWEVKLRRGVNTLCTELGVPLAREVCRRVGSGGEPGVLAFLSLWERKWEEGKVYVPLAL